jgi:cell division septal protein FtsQ
MRANGAWDNSRVICSMFFLFCAFVLIQLLTAPAFAAMTPTVTGNKGLATSEILDAVRGAQGRNLFMLDSGQLLSSVLRLPGVKDARVRLELPNRVVIEITDQEPQIIWEARGARYLVDAQGEAIKPATGAGRFLLITDPNPAAESLATGKRVDKRAIATVQQLETLLSGQVKSYEWAANIGVSVVMNEGWRAIIGWDDDLQVKVDVMKAAARSATQRQETLKSVDVRTPERPSIISQPAVKPTSTASR